MTVPTYDVPEPKDATKEELELFKKTKLIPVRLRYNFVAAFLCVILISFLFLSLSRLLCRVVNVVKQWLNRHYEDFEGNLELQSMMRTFISLLNTTGSSGLAEQLERSLTKVVTIQNCSFLSI